MKNRISVLLVGSLVILAIIGLVGKFTEDPMAFLQSIAVIALVGLAIYFIILQIRKSNPQKREQQAFIKAAKKSKKRLQSKSGEPQAKVSSIGTLTSIKKNKKPRNSSIHLTVIEGKKGKKKNRASL